MTWNRQCVKLIVVMVQMKARMNPVHPAVDWLYLCLAATAAFEKACLQSSSASIWTTELHNQVCCGRPFAFTPWPSASCICLSLTFLPLHLGLLPLVSAFHWRPVLPTTGILQLSDSSCRFTNLLSGRQYALQYPSLLQSFFERIHFLAFMLQQTCLVAMHTPDGTPTLHQVGTLTLNQQPTSLIHSITHQHCADCVAFSWCTNSWSLRSGMTG